MTEIKSPTHWLHDLFGCTQLYQDHCQCKHLFTDTDLILFRCHEKTSYPNIWNGKIYNQTVLNCNPVQTERWLQCLFKITTVALQNQEFLYKVYIRLFYKFY